MIESVVLVRHSQPALDAARPRGEWPLSDAGIAVASRLGEAMADLLSSHVLAASTEVKAVQTAEALCGWDPAVDVRCRAELGEVEHPWIESSEEKRASTLAYLRGTPMEGWEPQDAVVERFDRGLAELGEARVAVVSHGMAISLWLACQVPDLDACEFWAALGMPDAWHLQAGRLAHLH